MRSRALLLAGCAVLALAWFVPWHALAHGRFSAHMIVHVAVVAAAAPLIALGLAGTRLDPVLRAPAWFPPIPLSIAELVVVWAWHTPALHHAARHSSLAWALEQLCFLGCGVLVWLSAVGGDANPGRRAAGLVALLLTFMHMTLLGALLGLSPRVLYGHGHLPDQHMGGAIMLLVGGVSYLAGGVWIAFDLLRRRRAPR